MANETEASGGSCVGQNNALFKEKDEVLAMLSGALLFGNGVEERENDSPGEQGEGEIESEEGNAQFEKIWHILEKYQEQSSLLDPHLEEIVSPIMDAVKAIVKQNEKEIEDYYAENRTETDTPTNSLTTTTVFPFQIYRNKTNRVRLQLLFKTLYVLCKIRGYKTIVKLLPHEVADLEPTLRLLLAQDPADYKTWETRYMILLWLSMLAIIPFDLSTVDSSTFHGQDSGGSLVETLISICKSYLKDSGPTREASAVCLSKLLTRPDMDTLHLRNFLEWATETLENISDSRKNDRCEPTLNRNVAPNSHDIFLVQGILFAAVGIFKYGHRDNLLSHVDTISSVFQRVITVSTRDGHINSLERKLTIKLVQRVGLTFLPPRIVTWRYQRGQRSLLDNLSNKANISQVENPDEDEDSEDENEEEILEEIEQVIEQLLGGLRDKDTIVRWSAAKGIGRVTSRLTKSLADDVVEFVLELFDASEGDSAWHGGCLALAELARRGLLLPARLEQVVPFLLKALVYDVRRGQTSVGGHVRDAACYLCWAFARAYAPGVMAPFVQDLSQMMLVTAVFDREVNCRRAASAAFQENVGRQGHENFKHGIEILSTADYFSLGNRANAYLKISKFIAKFEVYRRPLIDHLLQVKISHWDIHLRELSAKALSELTPLDPAYMAETAIPMLLSRTLSPDMLVRHGATLALSGIILALANVSYQLPDATLTTIRNTVMKIEKARLYRGRGGEWMRVAACKLIENICLSGHLLSERAQLRLLDSIDESLKHPKDDVKNAAVAALTALSYGYFDPHSDQAGADAKSTDFSDGFDRPALPQFLEPVKESVVKRTVDKYCQGLVNDPNPAVRRAYALALGALPGRIVGANADVLEKVLTSLVHATKLAHQLPDGDPEMNDAETRRNAVESLTKLACNVGFNIEQAPANILDLIKVSPLNTSQLDLIFNTLLVSCDDYDTDNRGDVGSWVRCAAMDALCKLTYFLRSYPGAILKMSCLQNRDDKKDQGMSVNLYDKVETKNGMGIIIRWIIQDKVGWVKYISNGKVSKVVKDEILSICKAPCPLVEPSKEGNFDCSNDITIPGIKERETFLSKDASAKASASLMTESKIPNDELGIPVPSLFRVLLDSKRCHKVVSTLIKQLCEKMDNVRDCAGVLLVELLQNSLSNEFGIPLDIPELPTLCKICGIKTEKMAPFGAFQCDTTVNWKVETETYPRISALLGVPEYVVPALQGLVLSVGALTESVSKRASCAVLDWCIKCKRENKYATLKRFANVLLDIFLENAKCDRVIVPVLKTLDILLNENVFEFMHEDESDGKYNLMWFLKIHDAVRSEIRGTRNVVKLLATVPVFSALLVVARPVRTAALGSLVSLLGHSYPKVRKAVAGKMYLACIGLGEEAICGWNEPNIPTPIPDDENRVDSESKDEHDVVKLMDMVQQHNDKVNRRRKQNDEYADTFENRPDLQPVTPESSENEQFDISFHFEETLNTITGTEWDELKTADARKVRDSIYGHLRLCKPKVKAKAKKSLPENTEEQNDDTYASLIKSMEMGY